MVLLSSRVVENLEQGTSFAVFAERTPIDAAHHLRKIQMNLMAASVVESCYSLSERKLNAELGNG